MFEGSRTDCRYRIERVDFSGNVDFDQVLAAVRDLLAREAFHRPKLWDFRECVLEFTREQLLAMGSDARQVEQAPSRIAMLVDNDINYGICRMHRGTRETRLASAEVFRDEAEAIAWLTRD